jgi:hypothetical protein
MIAIGMYVGGGLMMAESVLLGSGIHLLMGGISIWLAWMARPGFGKIWVATLLALLCTIYAGGNVFFAQELGVPPITLSATIVYSIAAIIGWADAYVSSLGLTTHVGNNWHSQPWDTF